MQEVVLPHVLLRQTLCSLLTMVKDTLHVLAAACMGKQSDVVYHIPSCFGIVYIGVTRWELKMRIPACIDYSDVELPANKPGVFTHPSHIGYHHISPLSCSYCWWLCWYLLFPV